MVMFLPMFFKKFIGWPMGKVRWRCYLLRSSEIASDPASDQSPKNTQQLLSNYFDIHSGTCQMALHVILHHHYFIIFFLEPK